MRELKSWNAAIAGGWISLVEKWPFRASFKSIMSQIYDPSNPLFSRDMAFGQTMGTHSPLPLAHFPNIRISLQIFFLQGFSLRWAHFSQGFPHRWLFLLFLFTFDQMGNEEHPKGASLETCDLWDIWSEWWEDMTWPKKTLAKTILETCDKWDTDCNSDS